MMNEYGSNELMNERINELDECMNELINKSKEWMS